MKIDELKKNIEAQIMKKEEEKRSREHLIKLEKEKKRLEKETKAALKKKAILNRRKAEKELKSIDVKEKEKEGEKEEEKVSTKPEIRYIVNSRPVNDSVTSVTVFDKMHQRYVCNLTTKNPDKAIENLIISYGPGVTKISNWNK